LESIDAPKQLNQNNKMATQLNLMSALREENFINSNMPFMDNNNDKKQSLLNKVQE
jgi:hypothetical protein